MSEVFDFKDIKKMSKAELIDELSVWRKEVSAHLMSVAKELDRYKELGTYEEITEVISSLYGMYELQLRDLEDLTAAYDELASDPLGVDHFDSKTKTTPSTTH